MTPSQPMAPEVRLTFDEATVLLALLELLPEDPDTPDLAGVRERWRERLRLKMAAAVAESAVSA